MALKEYKDGVPTGREYMSEEDALKKKHQDMFDSIKKRKCFLKALIVREMLFY